MELPVSPFPVTDTLRQTVRIILICFRIKRIDSIQEGIGQTVLVPVIEIPDRRDMVFLTAHIFIVDKVGAGKHADRLALCIDLPPLVVDIKDLLVTPVIDQTCFTVDKIDRCIAVAGDRIRRIQLLETLDNRYQNIAD